MNSKEIKYLTFEGGGGKCIAYLGAIKALEEKKILPLSHVNTVNFKTDDLDINIPQNNLFGISGSSGGALIAFFLSMGLDFQEMESLFNEPFDKNSNQYITFLDYPQSNLKGINFNVPRILTTQTYRSVTQMKVSKDGQIKYYYTSDFKDIQLEELSLLAELFTNTTLIKKLTEDFKDEVGLIYKIIFNYFGKINTGIVPVGILLKTLIDQRTQKLNDVIAKRFLLNLYSGRGIFVGGGIRAYLQNKLEKYLLTPANISRFKQIFKSSPNKATLSFTQFFALTGVNLIVTGTNITLNRPRVLL
jgi:NTE family protein